MLAAEQYYESMGQNWERAAMIKARAVAGDVALGEAFEKLALIDRQGKGQADGDPWHSLDHLVCALCQKAA